MFRKDKDEPVLVDLGLVRDLSLSSLTQTWIMRGPGTPYFASPEQLNNDKYLIGWKSDQFSLGVVLSICLTKQHPYHVTGMDIRQVVNAVASRKGIAQSFRDKMKSVGLGSIAAMVEGWPIRRFQGTEDLIRSFD